MRGVTVAHSILYNFHFIWRIYMLEMYDKYDDYDFYDYDDYCYECSGYGDNYYVDEYGDFICACDNCLYNRFYDLDEW